MPAVPEISVVDNEDGTATVTIADSDGGTTNTVYTAPVRGGSWTSGGSRTGDGTVAVTLSGGVYLWRVESDDSGDVSHSNVVMNRVSGAELSTYERILQQVHSELQGASLSGLEVDHVALHTVPQHIRCATLVVAPFGSERMMMGQREGTNERDDTSYPVIVAHADPANRDASATRRNKSLKWRQDVARMFRRQHLTAVPEVRDCTINYSDVVDSRAWFEANLLVGSLTLNFIAREVRTL